MWEALDDICVSEGLNIHEICSMIDTQRVNSSRTSAVRAFILSFFRNAVMEAGMLSKDGVEKVASRASA